MEPFKLERFFARHEFTARYLLGPSDCEPLALREVLAMATPESLRLWEELRLAYTESQGLPALREEIARLYQSIAASDVLTAAPEEAIFVALQSLLRPGDHVVVLTPAYQSLHEIARGAGCDVTRWDLVPGDGAWRLDLDALKRHITSRTRLLVVNFPHNPTGFLPSLSEFEEIVAIARRHDLYLFSDEMYRMLEHPGSPRLPAACDLYEKAISLSGLSKSFALPGLRTGWLAMRDRDLLERCLAFKDYTTICQSAPSEILALIALQAAQAILDRNRAIVAGNLSAAREFFRARRDRFTWLEPQGGSVIFPIWTGHGTVDELCERVLNDLGVLMVAGSLFDFSGNHFRVGLGRRNLSEILDVLSRHPLLAPA